MRPHRPPPHLFHASVALPRWQRHTVWWACSLLWFSGLVWLALYWLLPEVGADGLPADQSAKLWAMRLHAACALATVFVVGSLLPVHMRTAWRVHRNRLSGLANLLVFGVLLLSGYALWYVSEGTLRQGSAWLHWGLGMGALPLLWWHHRLGRRARARRTAVL